jgi:hypothetical protein
VSWTYGREIELRAGDTMDEAYARCGWRADASIAWRVTPGADFIARLCETGWNHVPTCTAVVRGPVQKRAGGYRPDLPHSGDLEMWLRASLLGAVAETDAFQGVRRMHAANMFNAYPGVRDLRQRQAAFESFFAEDGRALPDGPRPAGARQARPGTPGGAMGARLPAARRRPGRAGVPRLRDPAEPGIRRGRALRVSEAAVARRAGRGRRGQGCVVSSPVPIPPPRRRRTAVALVSDRAYVVATFGVALAARRQIADPSVQVVMFLTDASSDEVARLAAVAEPHGVCVRAAHIDGLAELGAENTGRPMSRRRRWHGSGLPTCWIPRWTVSSTSMAMSRSPRPLIRCWRCRCRPAASSPRPT